MRRILAALLILFVALAGVAVCSRGVQACAAMQAANPDCCGNGDSLAASDCCCPAKGGQTAAFLPAGALVKMAGFDPLLATAPILLEPIGAPAERATWTMPLARALAPPETPVSLHTSLLV